MVIKISRGHTGTRDAIANVLCIFVVTSAHRLRPPIGLTGARDSDARLAADCVGSLVGIGFGSTESARDRDALALAARATTVAAGWTPR